MDERPLSSAQSCYLLAATVFVLFAPTLWFYGAGVLISLICAGVIAGIPAAIGLVFTAMQSRS